MSQYNLAPRAICDFETRSPVSLRDQGSWKYSLDPRTEVLCLAFRLPHWRKGRTGLWHPAFPHLGIEETRDVDDLRDFFRWVISGGLIEAHNAFFERGVWRNILERQGWPHIGDSQWRCSAAKAAAHALPRGLEDAIAAMNLPDVAKDTEGEKIMKTMVKPRNPVKADRHAWAILHAPCKYCRGERRIESYKKDGSLTVKGEKCPMCGGLGFKDGAVVPDMPLLYLESRELMERLWLYNRMDVLAEEALSEQLPDLTPFEQRIYELDQTVNERGFQVDTDAVESALVLIDHEFMSLNAELRELTGGEVEKATQRERMKAWLETQGLKLYDTRAETLDDILDQEDEEELPPWVTPPTPAARRALELMRMLGRSSTKKYVAMQGWACADGRVRGALLYHGATTGRWTGKGIQPHNFPKAALYEEVP